MEEYIKQVEDIISFLDDAILYADSDDYDMKKAQKDKMALKYLLKRYKELEQENERLNKLDLSNSKLIANMSERHYHDREKIRNSIPISVIQNKINEYREENRKLYNEEGIIVNERMVKNKLRAEILQELLEERNNK